MTASYAPAVALVLRVLRDPGRADRFLRRTFDGRYDTTADHGRPERRPAGRAPPMDSRVAIDRSAVGDRHWTWRLEARGRHYRTDLGMWRTSWGVVAEGKGDTRELAERGAAAAREAFRRRQAPTVLLRVRPSAARPDAP